MEHKEIEKRACIRFELPGATVSYKKKLFFSKKKYGEEFCPVLDISKGGLRFLCQRPLKNKSKAYLKISIPGERIPLTQIGQVQWASFSAGKSYKYQIGVQFNPYGEKRGQNSPENLTKIIALEQIILPTKADK